MHHIQSVSVLLAICTCALLAPTVATAQTTAPTTRHVLLVPPGFVRVDQGRINAICLPEDEPWVRQTLAALNPTTRPSTMPSDLLQRAEGARTEITRQIQADLAIEDLAKINPLFDEKLLPMLRQFDELRPPIFYMATTRDKLRELLKGGWEDPRFRYNRAADDVIFKTAVNLTIDRPLDDTILPAIYTAGDSVERRAEIFADTVAVSQQEIINVISERSTFLTQMAFVQFINDDVMKELDLKTDQAWLALGVTGWLSTKYAAPMIGIAQDELLAMMTVEHRRAPVKIATVDLLHPTPASELREQYVPHYLDAMRRKSTLVVKQWVISAGDEAIPKTIAQIRQTRPVDGPALVKLIQETTGIDLTTPLAAK